jgi:hypothetical protein
MSTPRIGVPSGSAQIVSDTSCTSLGMQSTIQNYTPTITPTRAGNIANSSSQYLSTVASLGHNYTFTFVNPGVVSNYSVTTCALFDQSYDVAYSVLNLTTNVSGQLSIYVDPVDGAVNGSNLFWPMGTGGSHGGSSMQWTGYTSTYGGPYTPTYVGASWSGFGISPNSGFCGAVTFGVGICKTSFWSGLTHTPSGSTGIYQSGFDAAALCYSVLIGFVCFYTYTGWYEFYKAAPNYCLTGIGSGDLINSFTGPYNSGNDFSSVYDATIGKVCWGVKAIPGSMGPAHNAQWQVESDLNPANGIYQTPDFNFYFNPAYAGGYPANLTSWVGSQASVPGVTLYAMQYGTSPCPGLANCFRVSA